MTPQLVIGVFFTLLGILLMLERLNIIETSISAVLAVVLIAIGIGDADQAPRLQRPLLGMTWTALGSWLLLNSLGILRIRVWELIGPVLLIVIGWSIVRGTLKADAAIGAGPPYDRRPRPDVPATAGAVRGRRTDGARRCRASHEGGRVNLVAVMGEAKRASNDQPFRGGEMTAFMGGCVLDLRQATSRPATKRG